MGTVTSINRDSGSTDEYSGFIKSIEDILNKITNNFNEAELADKVVAPNYGLWDTNKSNKIVYDRENNIIHIPTTSYLDLLDKKFDKGKKLEVEETLQYDLSYSYGQAVFHQFINHKAINKFNQHQYNHFENVFSIWFSHTCYHKNSLIMKDYKELTRYSEKKDFLDKLTTQSRKKGLLTTLEKLNDHFNEYFRLKSKYGFK